ncbi:MAG: hypothetical protein JNL92_16510 [Opitutaceae bacterium]|nr:hypothetical protein [Opitutaceae bacterium]
MPSSRSLSCARRIASRVFLMLALPLSPLLASDTPPPPASALSGLVKKLTEKRAAPSGAKPTKEQLLRPEFRFKAAPNWLLLPQLARQLTSNDTEREAVFALMDAGAREARKLLAAEADGADRDVAAATSLFASQLWGIVRQVEPSEEAGDALHAQIVSVLAGPEIAQVSDADKQKYWEFCLGFQVFVMGMKEVATDPASQEDLRKIAAAGFESLIGVNPHLVDLGPQGMVVRAGLEEAARKVKEDEAAAANPPPVTIVRAPTQPPAAAPAGGPAVSGITYTPPAGWAREEANWATIFRATLFDVLNDGTRDPRGEGRHPAAIFVMPPRAMSGSAHATFDEVWRQQFEAFELGDTVVHYRARIKSGLVVHYMGRFFNRKVRAEGALKPYAVLYLVDLGGGRVQPITALVEPVDASTGMNSFKESAAFNALWRPLLEMLESIQPAGGRAPYPSGGFFAASDLQGNWGTTSSAYGGSYVNTMTGMSAGVAVSTSGGSFRLGTDGTYDYSFAYASSHPQFGNSGGSEKHSGRYRLDGDIVLVEPSKPIGYTFTCCAVGIGTRQTPQGLKRILVTVGANSDGAFISPQLMPSWDYYRGVMTWYVEK